MAGFVIRAVSVSAMVSAAAFLAGCSSSGGGGGAGTTSASAATGSSSAAVAGTAVTATEKEYSISLSTQTFTSGPYTFTVHNTGETAHNLTIEGPGVDKQATSTIQPGQTATLAVTFQKGTYELWCSVDEHKDQGMDLHITVG
jgi:plastocyanin